MFHCMDEAIGGYPGRRLDGPTDRFTTDDTDAVLYHCVRLLLDRLSNEGWERAGWEVLHRCSGGSLSSLCDYDPDVLDLTAADQRIIYQILAFSRKRADYDLGIDKRSVAREKFLAAESTCRLTNRRFRHWQSGGFTFPRLVERVLHTAQRKIADVLGPDVPSIEELRPRFGPGATTRVPKKNACLVTKLASRPTCSTSLTGSIELLTDSLASVNLSQEGLIDVNVDHSALAFVPKTAKTDRSIATEPSLSGMFQLAIGDLLAEKLRRVGIDIRDQSRNQRAAYYGSLSGRSATIDLSSASDTVSTKLVEHLLPSDWFDLLSRFRSGTMVDKDGDEVLYLEKISTMGNGFTFPLETLLFWALSGSTQQCVDPRSQVPVLAYGDDIIVSSYAAPFVIEVLRELGFTANAQKSFWTGTFRESCGCDYVSGSDVRPYFVTDALSFMDVIRLRNQFWAAGDSTLSSYLQRFLPTDTPWGPRDLGDGHLWQEVDPFTAHVALYKARRGRGFAGQSFLSWTRRPRQLKKDVLSRFASITQRKVPRWDPRLGEWEGTERKKVIEFKSSILARRVATYTAYQSERPLGEYLMMSDRLRGGHVYKDRRLPNPDSLAVGIDPFTVPDVDSELDALHLTRIYILNT